MIPKTYYIKISELPSITPKNSLLFSDDVQLDFFLYFLKNKKNQILKKYCL